MEAVNQKSLERVVSHKAMQMGSSFPCQICVVGFLCGVCLTSLFLATLTNFGTFQFGRISFSSISMANSTSSFLGKSLFSLLYYFSFFIENKIETGVYHFAFLPFEIGGFKLSIFSSFCSRHGSNKVQGLQL